jgi:hypothetical protein
MVFIMAQAHRQSRLEDRSLPRLKQHHYKEPEPLACVPTILKLKLAHCRALEVYRYRFASKSFDA